MKYLFLIVLFWNLIALGQQTIELCPGESKIVTYSSVYTGDGNNIWTVNGQNYDQDQLMYTFNTTGTYNITLRRDNVLCYAEQTYQVVVVECVELVYWVPNSFTPDSDEHNQTFGPVMYSGFDPNNYKFTIINRWGEVIWESNDPEARWDGAYSGLRCQSGVYIWKINIKLPKTDERIIEYGHLNLLR